MPLDNWLPEESKSGHMIRFGTTTKPKYTLPEASDVNGVLICTLAWKARRVRNVS
jgi:hypothetical protein